MGTQWASFSDLNRLIASFQLLISYQVQPSHYFSSFWQGLSSRTASKKNKNKKKSWPGAGRCLGIISLSELGGQTNYTCQDHRPIFTTPVLSSKEPCILTIYRRTSESWRDVNNLRLPYLSITIIFHSSIFCCCCCFFVFCCCCFLFSLVALPLCISNSVSSSLFVVPCKSY